MTELVNGPETECRRGRRFASPRRCRALLLRTSLRLVAYRLRASLRLVAHRFCIALGRIAQKLRNLYVTLSTSFSTALEASIASASAGIRSTMFVTSKHSKYCCLGAANTLTCRHTCLHECAAFTPYVTQCMLICSFPSPCRLSEFVSVEVSIALSTQILVFVCGDGLNGGSSVCLAILSCYKGCLDFTESRYVVRRFYAVSFSI